MGVVLAFLAVEVRAVVIVTAAVLGTKALCDAQASIKVPSTEKCSSDNSGLTCGWFRSRVMNFANTSPFCSRSRFLVKLARPGRPARAPRTSGTRDCSPVAPSTGAPTECRRTPVAAMRSAIAPEGSRGGLHAGVKLPKATVHLAQHIADQIRSSSADGSQALVSGEMYENNPP
jgi:hypothetical protein